MAEKKPTVRTFRTPYATQVEGEKHVTEHKTLADAISHAKEQSAAGKTTDVRSSGGVAMTYRAKGPAEKPSSGESGGKESGGGVDDRPRDENGRFTAKSMSWPADLNDELEERKRAAKDL